MHLLRPFVAMLGLMATVGAARAADPEPGDNRAVENLAALARVYGYVRFFHPSDEASAADWDKVAVLGAETVRDALDAAALRAALLKVFQPIAPRLALGTAESPLPVPGSVGADDSRKVFWQYQGVGLSDKSNIYRQRRVTIGAKWDDHAPLFQPAVAPSPLIRTIAPGVVLRLPLALTAGTAGGKSERPSAEDAALTKRRGELDLDSLSAEDWRLRVAGVIVVWSVFQHFHPYLDGRGVKWDETLRPALRRALRDRTAADYHATLSELVAQTQDGHGYVYGRASGLGGIPIRVAVIEDQLTITGVADNAPFQKGDIIERLDGVPAPAVLAERERYAAGSPHLRRFRALNQFGEGPLASVAQLDIVRDGRRQTIDFPRRRDWRGYFFNPIGEFEFPALTEVRPGIFYVNLYQCDAPGLAAKLAQLAAARGVIFDSRFDGRMSDNRQRKTISPHEHIIPYLIAEKIQASPMLVPQVTQPDRIGWTYRESTWPVQPRAPRFQGRIVFINEPSVVSYGETCMAMIADYRLATLVGAPTAGTNGNANYIPLPGGLRVMWTGMDVRKHDRTSFYGVGFVPDVPVTRTLRAVKEGRDEYLEAAIAVIEGTSKQR